MRCVVTYDSVNPVRYVQSHKSNGDVSKCHVSFLKSLQLLMRTVLMLMRTPVRCSVVLRSAVLHIANLCNMVSISTN